MMACSDLNRGVNGSLIISVNVALMLFTQAHLAGAISIFKFIAPARRAYSWSMTAFRVALGRITLAHLARDGR